MRNERGCAQAQATPYLRASLHLANVIKVAFIRARRLLALKAVGN